MNLSLLTSVASDADVRDAYARYQMAACSGDRLTRIKARVSLVAVLTAHGWEPPALVQEQVKKDAVELARATNLVA